VDELASGGRFDAGVADHLAVADVIDRVNAA
jgi:hypothetical protein